jgi:hypothetical protein
VGVAGRQDGGGAVSDPAILFTKPKSISLEDRKALQKAGVIVVEVADPASVTLTRPHADLPGSTLLALACSVISELGNTAIQQRFGRYVAEAIVAEHAANREVVS